MGSEKSRARSGARRFSERKKWAILITVLLLMILTITALLVRTFFCRYGKTEIRALYKQVCASFLVQAQENGETIDRVRISVDPSFDNDFLWGEDVCSDIRDFLQEEFGVEVMFSDTEVTAGDTGCLYIRFHKLLSRDFTSVTLRTRCVGTTWKRTTGDEVYRLDLSGQWQRQSTTGKVEKTEEK